LERFESLEDRTTPDKGLDRVKISKKAAYYYLTL
jgi:hypothetical protein